MWSKLTTQLSNKITTRGSKWWSEIIILQRNHGKLLLHFYKLLMSNLVYSVFCSIHFWFMIVNALPFNLQSQYTRPFCYWQPEFTNNLRRQNKKKKRHNDWMLKINVNGSEAHSYEQIQKTQQAQFTTRVNELKVNQS